MISIENKRSFGKTDLNALPHPKIHPIRKYKVKLNQLTLQRQIVKNVVGKIWEYKSENYGDRFAELKKVFRMIKASKACQKLNCGVSWKNVSNKDMSLISQGLKRLGSLKSLRLITYMHQDVTHKSVEVLSRGVKELPLLRSLDLRLLELQNTIDGSVKNLSQAFKRLGFLKEIVLYVDHRYTGVSGDERLMMKCLNRGLKRLDAVETVCLGIGQLGWKRITCVPILTQCLRRLPILTNLKLIVPGLYDNEYEMLAECLGNLGLLKILSLDFDSITSVGNQEIGKLAKALEKLKNLSDLHLNLSQCESISNDGLEVLSQSLQQMASLEKINLEFDRNPVITSDGLYHVAQALPKMSHIKFNFNHSGLMTNHGMQSLLEGLKNPRTLVLDFGQRGWLANSDIEMIIYSLYDLDNLETLTLVLGSRRITPVVFYNLRKSLERLVWLENLKLGFRLCEGFGDAELKQISEGLKGCNALQNLHLDFSTCDNITDGGLQSFAEALEGLESLRTLFLSFDECSQISDEGLESLAKGLGNISRLQSLAINFEGTGNETRNGMNILLSNLAQFDCLQNLELTPNEYLGWEDRIRFTQAFQRKFPAAYIYIKPYM